MTSWKTLGSLILIGAASLSTFGGCTKAGPASNYPAPGASQGDEPEPAPVSQSADLNDRQIVGILTTVDAAEIEQARLALTRATDPGVKQFAAHMIEQHGESTQKAASLSSQFDMMPAASTQASSLRDNAAKLKGMLNAVSASAFDASYMKAQVEQHQALLEMLRAQLIPAARNPALTVQLRAAHTMVQNHLSEAREFASQLQPDGQNGAAAAAPAPK